MNTEWFKGKTPTIAYDDPLCRWAYIFAHVAVHANCLENVLRKCESENRNFAKRMREDELSILAFGGGPGTELMALAKHFALIKERDKDHDQVDVELTIVDRVSAWSENITSVRAEIDRLYKKEFGCPQQMAGSFQCFRSCARHDRHQTPWQFAIPVQEKGPVYLQFHDLRNIQPGKGERLLPRSCRWPARAAAASSQWFNSVAPNALMALGV
jgi:Putative SAM-dependent methyltransferase